MKEETSRDCVEMKGAHQAKTKREDNTRTLEQWRSLRGPAPTLCRAVLPNQGDQDDDLEEDIKGAAGLEEGARRQTAEVPTSQQSRDHGCPSSSSKTLGPQARTWALLAQLGSPGPKGGVPLGPNFESWCF
ncbi:hypothetical protein GWK47_033042 [Chionoecetes opilio]|uniref:Uncharacterized protein n=1 Tax=Chionoecetes opilio TaxID=41210 RepID=A0A8J4YJZ6_CHIOP|nr:hypothetical protein GWK47_033042 [Chionoecetes opilio]